MLTESCGPHCGYKYGIEGHCDCNFCHGPNTTQVPAIPEPSAPSPTDTEEKEDEKGTPPPVLATTATLLLLVFNVR